METKNGQNRVKGGTGDFRSQIRHNSLGGLFDLSGFDEFVAIAQRYRDDG
ncbi:MAG: hypothetical protein WAV07_01665 [Candidatus Contendobacter sp.]